MASPADEYVPIINQPATMIACTTVFQIIATASVALRLHARFKIINGFGADDVFVLLSLVGGPVLMILNQPTKRYNIRSRR